MNKLLLYCYYYLLWQPDSVLFNEKETHILKKKKHTTTKKQTKTNKKLVTRSTGAAILACSLHPTPLPRGETSGICRWGCAAKTLEPLAYTRPRFSLILICYPILE